MLNLRRRIFDEKGQCGVQSVRGVTDAGFALGTAISRVVCSHLLVRPWITSDAFRFLKKQVRPGMRVFEWGSGMSTLWYDQQGFEVHAVEDNAQWADIVRKKLRRGSLYHLSGQDYVQKIGAFEKDYFDIITVDGRHRLACYRQLLERRRPGLIAIIDNTDKDRHGGDLLEVDRDLDKLPDARVFRFPGYAAGSFFAQETSIVVFEK
ncbi:O-methyltransferase [Paludibaculum fermentans]|uniref:Class I SAM-dependent methyltransferase n=1 Tax=Paludibaculum fermentans TaxID=1473598 RepID=A0A7S7NK62_PALFE|nr:hypothetical protein [Paludibaculum fermentans]QOY85092.1 hypothetical protein IRI77_19830 [Paludibaculum fermentans]